MARLNSTRSPSAESSAGKRRRQSSDHTEPQKRRVTTSGLPRLDREGSPNKSVHFPRRLEMGRTGSGLGDQDYRRSASPERSQMRDLSDMHGASKKRKADYIGTDPTTLLFDGHEEPHKARQKHFRPGPKSNGSRSRVVEKQTSDLTDEIDVTHDQICEQINGLREIVHRFANTFPKKSIADVLQSILKHENDHLIRYIGCLAMGGKSGIKGWQELLNDTKCRQALVLGIIGRALKENVFSELCFGADEELQKMLKKMEQDQMEKDGFFRARERADAISAHEVNEGKSNTLFGSGVARITTQLEQMLLPLWTVGGKTWQYQQRDELSHIVGRAALLSIDMRKDRDTIYYWPPTFKDEMFEPPTMESINLADMKRESPWITKESDGVGRREIQEGQEARQDAIVQIVCFPALVAYRQGGGELAESELGADNHRLEHDHAPPDVMEHRKYFAARDGLTGNEGFRTRTICKAIVYLQWGRQRLLTREAGTSAHIDAIRKKDKKYVHDYEGFVELYDHFLAICPPSVESVSPQSPPRSASTIASLRSIFSTSTQPTSVGDDELPLERVTSHDSSRASSNHPNRKATARSSRKGSK